MTIDDRKIVERQPPGARRRCYIFRPTPQTTTAGKFPALLFYSEIFQVTAPIRRTAAYLAGHGFIVAVPEVYHEFLPAGTVLAYDQAGADKGNELQNAKEIASYDDDARAGGKWVEFHEGGEGRGG